MTREIDKATFKLSLLLVVSLALSFFLAGCGSDSDSHHDASANVFSGTALISAATLQEMMAGDEDVVLIDVTKADAFAEGHIPGAQFWNVAEHVQKRVEGPAPAVNMVLDGPSMDALIQKHGIEADSTIVITSSQAANYFPSRAYFLLRYWGFPKDQIKVLNGYNGAWTGDTETGAWAGVTSSTLSVTDLAANFSPDERVALSELMIALEEGSVLPVDFRGDKSAAGSTAGVYDPPDNAVEKVVFEGTLKGGKSFGFGGFTNEDKTFKSPAEIEVALSEAGIDDAKTIVSYCRTGYIASTGYFVLDGILGWEVMAYDGSWSQWGKMSDDAGKGGDLPAGSLWAVDNALLMDVINYNADADSAPSVPGFQPYAIETLQYDAAAHAAYPDPYAVDAQGDPVANQVENDDYDYANGL